jgi:hypothetical protein
LIGLFAALALFQASSLPQAPDVSPTQLGEDVSMAGGCGVFGWTVDLEQEPWLFGAYFSAHPDTPPEQIRNEARAGALALIARLEAELDEISDTAAFRVWAAGIEARCDRITRDYPTLLRRSEDTPTRWAAARARFEERYTR